MKPIARTNKSKLLITGAAGFIGSEFCRQAVHDGYKCVVVDKLTYAGDLQRLKDVRRKITFHKADIANKPAMRRVFKAEKPDIVVHFAAESHVDRSILGSDEFVVTNVQGTQVLLDAAKEAEVCRFVHMSTDEVYGDILKGKFHETTPLNPSSPYSASKAASDLLVKSYMRTFDFPAVIVRASNNYGPWQYPEKFVPVIIHKALSHENIPVYGKGENVREWLHVSDCALGVKTVMEKGKLGEVYNIGTGHELKNIEIVRIILGIMGVPKELIKFVQDRPGHDLRYSLDSDKLRRELSWEPLIDFDTGIEATIEWYKANTAWVHKKLTYLKNYWKKVYRS